MSTSIGLRPRATRGRSKDRRCPLAVSHIGQSLLNLRYTRSRKTSGLIDRPRSGGRSRGSELDEETEFRAIPRRLC